MQKKIYFITDAHLGSKVLENPISHEQKLVRWLDQVKIDAEAIFMLGDMFDFWFEYKCTIPKGFNRFLGKMAELTDAGIPIHFFTGNHDLWTFGYLEKEIGLIVHRAPEIMQLKGKNFFLAHGDGLNDKNLGFRFIRGIFHNKVCQWLFSHLFPSSLGLKFGYAWSESNRKKHLRENVGYLGEKKEKLVLFAKKHSSDNPEINFYLFGHRHILLHLMLNQSTQMAILGDFINEFSYASFDGENFEIHFFEKE